VVHAQVGQELLGRLDRRRDRQGPVDGHLAPSRIPGLRFRDGGSTLRLLATGPNARSVQDIDTASGAEIASGPVAATAPASFYGLNALSEDARYLVVAAPAPAGAARAPTALSIWDLDRDSEAFRIPVTPGGPTPARVAFSPDGKTLAVARDDGSIQLWDLSTRQLRVTADAHGR
jgi:WD40 repeat protein